ncbi:assimilatory sulfite reductase (NADPH) flavoprotein subunit [Bacillus ndiopicus]|uniref:assimilatory sulfite reductase (NADPH) flavoprotein subunit n=1 Tax=Bacillus ndiopicus TaxID=1347368 RepID=UPI0005A88278|nr:assimilatory sulfite reductase (NADPH) flavoprotein subunit [Bacillus ndiopicus]
MTLQVLNSPFNEEQVKQLNVLLPTLNDYQKIWLTGYLSIAPAAGVAVLEEPAASIEEEVKSIATEPQSATILYGSQTGNAQALAEKLGAKLAEAGVDVTVASMSAFKTNQLKKLTNLFIVTSTHGEGTPPDNAIQFHEFLYGKRAPKLEHLQFSVLALGDSSYEFFCKTGADFDEQLEKLGAQRIAPRVDCDLDYDALAAQWFEDVKKAIVANDAQAALSQVNTATKEVGGSEYSKKNPFYAEVLEKINLNGRGSNKVTYHLELSLEGSGLTYAPGDSIGILPENDEQLVGILIEALGFQQTEVVTVEQQSLTLAEALQKKLEITVLSKPLLQKIQNYTVNPDFAALVQDNYKWKDYVYGRDLLDVVQNYGPFSWNAQQFVELLRKIPARLYSIASSQAANEDEAHLTIGKVSYETDGRGRQGVCSGQIAERIEIGQKLPIYIHSNPNFKLPQDDATAIIMIGAGTGIAPFRSFIEERAAREAEGKSWLFFGDQHFVTDYLYQTDWQGWIKDGALTNLTTAFSRDGDQKIYVQHRLQEHAKELYEWIEQGAIIYVCGDEKAMAADVDKMIHAIVAEQGGKSAEQAAEYVSSLKQQQRYQRDVY